MSSHPSELTWARTLAGELGWLARARIRRHVRSCARCGRLAEEIAEERRAFDADARRDDELRILRARAATPARGGRNASPPVLRAAFGAVALAAVAGAALVATRPPAEPALGAKGGDAVELVVSRAAGVRPLGARCAPGDRIMARYRTERRYLLLLERDGAGRVQTLLPRGGAASAPIEPGPGATAESFVLDATPGAECFVAVFSDAPVAAADAARAVRERPRAPEIGGASVRVRCCEKEVAP